MRILVTGGSGYIGSSVRKRLRGRFSFSNLDIKEDRKDDVRDFARVRRAVRGVEGVLHLAAISRPKWGFVDPHTCLTTNLVGTINVLEAIRQVNPRAWVIFGSSREVFGGVKEFPITEKSGRKPLNAYAVSKVGGEDLLRQYAHNYGLRCFTLRFCGVYTGKDDIPDRVIPRFIRNALLDEPIPIEGDGKNKKYDYVYIDDVLEAIRRSIRYIAKQRRGFYDDITLAAGAPLSLDELARMIVRLSESKSRIVRVPRRTYDQDIFWGTYEKAKRKLGWAPKVIAEEGLARAIRELRKQTKAQLRFRK